MKKLLEILKKIFAKAPAAQIPAPQQEAPVPPQQGEVLRREAPAEEIKPKMPVKKTLKLALVVGHEAKAKGAKAVSGIHEYDFFKMVTVQMKNKLEDSHVEVEEFLRDGRSIRATIQAAKAWGADICIELHYNAFNKTAGGSEALWVSKDNKLAKQCNDEWCKEQEISNRGIKVVTHGMNGFASVDEINRNNMRGFLWEPFFGDNERDYRTPAQVSDFMTKFFKKIH
jgi:N-acetylmuramoyl-L-alanine amidase